MLVKESNDMPGSVQTFHTGAMGETTIYGRTDSSASSNPSPDSEGTSRKLEAKTKTAKAERRVEENIKLVYYALRKLKVPPYFEQDCISEGFLTLWKCAKNFDEDKGFTFSTYAIRSIKGTMISVMNRKYKRYKDFGQSLSKEELGITIDEEKSHHDIPTIPIDILTPKEKVVIFCTFFKGMTGDQIGIELRCSRQNVSRILIESLTKLKAAMNELQEAERQTGGSGSE